TAPSCAKARTVAALRAGAAARDRCELYRARAGIATAESPDHADVAPERPAQGERDRLCVRLQRDFLFQPGLPPPFRRLADAVSRAGLIHREARRSDVHGEIRVAEDHRDVGRPAAGTG